VTNETTIATMAPADDAQRAIPPEVMEKAVIGGDLSELNAAQRADYYTAVCRSLGLNPLTKPFEFLTLNGKLRLYALRDCADQLRRLHGISIYIANRERMGDIYIVTARAKDRTGREDESTGAVPLGNLKGDALCNALMKGETKAKRRVTLSIAGLGWLDETELATIPGAQTAAPDVIHDETAGMSHPLPVGEDGTPGAGAPPHPTAEDITTLVDSARAANVDLEAFGHDMRRLMQLPESQKVTKKFLRGTMTMSQYNMARAHYGEALRQVLNQDVPDFPPQKEPTDGTTPPASPVSETALASVNVGESPPTEEGSPAVPSPAESSSAPGPDLDATEQDRQRLRQEVSAWDLRVPPEEVEHVIIHNPYSKARALLWNCRRKAPAATPIESVAD
jgi:hypothetical protein